MEELKRIDESIDAVIQNYRNPSLPPNDFLEFKVSPKFVPGIKEEKPILPRNTPRKIARGARICQLYLEHPILATVAQSRSMTNNSKRTLIWEAISTKISEEFEDLGWITVAEAKKLVDYYKGRWQHRSRLKSSPSASPVSSSSNPHHYLFPILRQSTPPTYSNPEEFEKYLESGKKERLHFLVVCTKEFMKQRQLENSTKSRLAVKNKQRFDMWQEIQEAVNWRFAEWEMPELGIDQVKKSFSNWKRRHPENFRVPPPRSLSPQSSVSTETSDFSEISDISSSSSSSSSSDPTDTSAFPEPPEVIIIDDSESESDDVEMDPIQRENAQLRKVLKAAKEELDFYKKYYWYNETIKICRSLKKTF